MPERDYTHEPVFVRVSPLTVAGSTVNQLAHGWCFETNETATELLAATIHIKLIPYAVDPDAPDGWGACLDGIGPYHTRHDFALRCDNDTLVFAPEDPTTEGFGKILAIRGRQLQPDSASAEAEWDAVVNNPDLLYMPQLKFMSYLRDNLPQVVGQVLRYNIAQADAMGRFTPNM
jgi:hypothetical protein